ncbi:hypothetical protein [Staphylococcus chromogenes]|uniref:hypothetical protein n=1 Tax=Staphylococcus chromogenes TaxID=46126 RepID=UPI00130031D8|nr:hypothetical protein [Staphylococcus chromogenes]
MKKILFVLFASLLVLSACGNDDSKEEKKTEQKEKKSEKKENKKEEKSIEEKQTSNTAQSPSQENVTVNDDQQPTTVGYNQSQNNQGNANLNGDIVVAPGWTEQQQQSEYEKYKQGQQEQIENGVEPGAQITYEEQMKANAEVAKQHGYTGIPNGDMMSTDKMDQFAREVIEEQN